MNGLQSEAGPCLSGQHTTAGRNRVPPAPNPPPHCPRRPAIDVHRWCQNAAPARPDGLEVASQGSLPGKRSCEWLQTMAPATYKPVWIDLSTADPVAAREFYEKVFGWNVEVNPDPQYGGYALARIDGKDVAGHRAQDDGRGTDGLVDLPGHERHR
jgi:hypothetical protein